MRLRTFSLFLVALAMMRAVSVMAFSLLGTNATWQTPDIGYQLAGDIGGPQYRNEEYRRVYPQVVYRFDNSFVRDFGTQGVAQVRQAFELMNSIGNVNNWSANLSEFPKDAFRLNYSASSQNLIDLKSGMLFYLLENLGLADSVRYIWTIRTVQRASAFTNFFVVQMNYDPVSWERTSYVNGRAYTYSIAIVPGLDEAVESPVGKAFSPAYYPVASGFMFPGYYYNKLSYDDAGGLRYIYRASNYKYEYITNAVTPTTLLTLGSYDNSNGYTIPNWGTTNIYIDIWGNAVTNNIVYGGWRGGLGRISYTEYSEAYPSNFVNWQDNVWNDDPTRNPYAAHVLQTVTRIVPKTLPDILVLSTDSGAFNVIGDRSIRWNSNAPDNGQGYSNGPGQSDTGTTCTFYKQFPLYWVYNPFFLDEDNRIISLRWGSYDGTTNAPYIHTK